MSLTCKQPHFLSDSQEDKRILPSSTSNFICKGNSFDLLLWNVIRNKSEVYPVNLLTLSACS